MVEIQDNKGASEHGVADNVADNWTGSTVREFQKD